MTRFCLLFLAAGLAAPAATEPRIQLKLPNFAGSAFPNFGVVALPASGYGPLEIWLENALAEVQVSTIRIKLNDTPMTPFVAINSLPRGFRAVVKQGASLSPDYNLRPAGENILSFTAVDESNVAYHGQFYLSLDPSATAPKLASVRPAPLREIEAPPEHRAPKVSFTSEWPRQTEEQFLNVDGLVEDAEGIRRVVIEVNGKDVEEIALENELPVRKHGGFMSHGKLAGQVAGDGRRMAFSIPVKLGKNLTVVAVRVENTLGLRARIDRTIERIKR